MACPHAHCDNKPQSGAKLTREFAASRSRASCPTSLHSWRLKHQGCMTSLPAPQEHDTCCRLSRSNATGPHGSTGNSYAQSMMNRLLHSMRCIRPFLSCTSIRVVPLPCWWWPWSLMLRTGIFCSALPGSACDIYLGTRTASEVASCTEFWRLPKQGQI